MEARDYERHNIVSIEVDLQRARGFIKAEVIGTTIDLYVNPSRNIIPDTYEIKFTLMDEIGAERNLKWSVIVKEADPLPEVTNQQDI